MSDLIYHHGHLVWRELMAKDFDRARAFYCELFEWTSEVLDPGGMAYTVFRAGEHYVGGGMQTPEDVEAPTHWAAYVSVADVDAALATAERLGGRGLYEPIDIPGTGRVVGVADAEGAVFALMRGAQGDVAPLERPPVGTFCWETLFTSDVSAAKSFYGEVVGWVESPGPDGASDLDIFAAPDGRTVADLQPADGRPSSWLSYVVVASHREVGRRAESLGGRLIAPSITVPNVGHIAILCDPTGGVVGVFEPPSAD